MNLFSKAALTLAAPIIAGLALLTAPRIEAQQFAGEYMQPLVQTLLSSATITNSQTLTVNAITNLVANPNSPQYVSVWLTLVSTNAGNFNSNVVCYFDTAMTGTNYTTTPVLIWTTYLNGNTNVVTNTVFPLTTTASVTSVRLTKVTTTSTNVPGFQATVQIGQTP